MLLLVAMLHGCAADTASHSTAPSTEWQAAEAQDCEDAPEGPCLAPLCEGGVCGLYRCDAVAPGSIVRTRGGAPVFIAPRGTARRNWGSAQDLPGKSLPVPVFRWHPKEPLPSELKRRRAMEEWASRPKERHHIFPQALKPYFQSKGIHVHDYVIAIDAELHKRIHRDANGAPWNEEWRQFRRTTRGTASKPAHFEHASLLIQKYGLFGLTMTYWQSIDLGPVPVNEG
ncbi:TIGR02269 family lipoprotein [Corallococcus sp. BB11-1]|uniref:SitA6 family polymorphic toxin lipoprotein n=1 Tax=Corallococcus sp. BB11-1 TaxID=2996783 RepID=UPI002270CB84|nr:TIGR02269 family lipoprotein [Corallococcus sp. BB11-1]MCY1032898.1 TIGR02269 family lipoprotein [Corallococcus sp. BB11-1]